MAQWLTENGYHPKLITSNPEALRQILDPQNIIVFPAIVEPPTYNVSTYAAMLYGTLKENITDLTDKLLGLNIPNCANINLYFFNCRQV